MNSEYLRTFVTLAQMGSYTKTAQKMIVVPSTISKHIKLLEEEAGKVLIVRDKKSIRLTKAGEIFLEYAHRILDAEDACMARLEATEDNRGAVRIGVVSSLFQNRVVPWLKAYLREEPSFRCSVVMDHSQVLLNMDTTFSALMSATISAPEDSNIDHEYPFETSEHKEIARKINGVRTSFTVELGRIASEIEETYQTKTAAGQQYTQLQSSIEQTAQSITATVAATYETKSAATQMEQRLNSTITQTANSITSTVSATFETKSDATAKLNTAKNYADAQDNAKAATITAAYRSEIAQTADSIKATVAASESKYAVPSGVSIAVYGYGAPPNSIAAAYNGRYYLDQSSGYYYRSNGTSWVKQNNTPLKLITDNLSSSITQTADSIRSEVRASYQSKADADNDYNTLYSFIEQRADSITLSVSSSSNGRTTFTLKDGSTTLDSEALYLNVRSANIVGTITADEVAARATIEAPNIYGGRYYDEDGRGSLYMDYGVGEGTLMYGYSSVDRMSDAFFGIQGDYVSNLANLYLAGSRRLEGVFGGRVYAYGTWDFSNATVILPS